MRDLLLGAIMLFIGFGIAAMIELVIPKPVNTSPIKTCIDGQYYIKNYGAVLGEFGAPVKCK